MTPHAMEVKVRLMDGPEMAKALERAAEAVEQARRERDEAEARYEEVEDRYEDLLAQIGGVSPG